MFESALVRLPLVRGWYSPARAGHHRPSCVVCRRLQSPLPPQTLHQIVLADVPQPVKVALVFTVVKVQWQSREARLVSAAPFRAPPAVLPVKLTPNHHAVVRTRCFLFVVETT
jgi:hypothetical protein